MMERYRSLLGWSLLLLAGLLFPFFVGNDYHLTVMSTAYLFAIATLGLNLIVGYTGQFNLAHASFMAIGAYTVGILTVDHGYSYWLSFFLAGVVTVAIGLPLGWVSLRLKGHYFSIFTLFAPSPAPRMRISFRSGSYFAAVDSEWCRKASARSAS